MLIFSQVKISFILILILTFSSCLFAQVPSPGKLAEKPILIYNAIIHDGLGNRIDNGFIHIEGRLIKAIGTRKEGPSASEISSMQLIDAKGKHIYPGFILLNSPLGLNEVDAVRATLDLEETGTLNPNSYSLPAFNTDSDIIPTLRLNGVLMAQISPRGPKFRGLSAVVHLDAWNWEDAVVKHRDAMHLKWPSKYKPGGWWAEPGPIEKSKEGNQKDLEEIKQMFEDGKAYSKTSNPVPNVRLEPFKGLFSGEIALYLHVSYATDIVAALQYARQIEIPKVVLVTGTQVLQVIDLVKSFRVPVVLNRIHSLPETSDEPADLQTRLPKMLVDAGVLVALDYEGDMEIMGARNLGFLAGSASREGLNREEALKLITSNPAKILGLQNTCGQLSVGSEATLFISEGDALDMKTQNLTHAWIQGRPIFLESKQTQLNTKFKARLGQ